MELEIRTKENSCSFMLTNIDAFMNEPRTAEQMKQIKEWLSTKWLQLNADHDGVLVRSITELDMAIPFEPTGNAFVILNLDLYTLVLKPNDYSYVHFPLYRPLPDWADYLI